MNQKLMDQFKVENMVDATFTQVAPSKKYVEWLERKIIESEWISVEDRLPKDEQDCDIMHKHWERIADCMFCNYEDSTPHFYKESTDDIIYIKDVTHWRPIPYPTK